MSRTERILNYFASRNDLLKVLKAIEAKIDLHYIEAGMFDDTILGEYACAADVPWLAVPSRETDLGGRHILMGHAATLFKWRTVPQRRGGVRFAMDQRPNPDTLAIGPGGVVDDYMVLAGRAGFCSDDAQLAQKLLRRFRMTAVREWTRIKSYLVSPEAAALLDAGARLCADARSPKEYDLTR